MYEYIYVLYLIKTSLKYIFRTIFTFNLLQVSSVGTVTFEVIILNDQSAQEKMASQKNFLFTTGLQKYILNYLLSTAATPPGRILFMKIP